MQFMYEGEEEILSPHLPAAMAKHKKLLEADFALSADGGQLAEPDIGLCIGARGATAVEVQVRTLAGDQHSGKQAHVSMCFSSGPERHLLRARLSRNHS